MELVFDNGAPAQIAEWTMVYTATPRTPAAPNEQPGTPPPEFISSSTQTSWEACTQICATTAECESVYWETTTETCSMLNHNKDEIFNNSGESIVILLSEYHVQLRTRTKVMIKNIRCSYENYTA